MSIIYMNESDLTNSKSKINFAKQLLEGIKSSLNPDSLATELSGKKIDTATYKALADKFEKIGQTLKSLDNKSEHLTKYIDEVIISYSSADRNLAHSAGGC